MDYRWRLSEDGRVVLSEGGERFSTVLSKIQSPSALSYSSDEINYHFHSIKVEIPKDIVPSAPTDRERFISIRVIENFKNTGETVSTKWMLSIFDNSPTYRDLFNGFVKCETDVQSEFNSEKELLKIFKLLKLAGFS